MEHQDLPWFVELGLRWHTVPLISNMQLLIGGIRYPAAPLNTWFVKTEIVTRGLADEHAYGITRHVTERLGMDTSTERTLRRDRAIEINRAVLFSFPRASRSPTTTARRCVGWPCCGPRPGPMPTDRRSPSPRKRPNGSGL